ncbi:hypothetical protein D3C76_323940 [compost metagenome]
MGRGLQVRGNHRRRGRSIAAGIGQHHLQVAAIFHRWVKGDLEGAVRVDRAVGQYIALGIAHLHAGPGFAAAIELGAGQADYQVGCGIRWCGVATVDVRRGDVAGRGGVAGGVGGGDL